MSSPLISIVLPTYNVEDYIERCLLSIVNQSYINFEIIIVDDCGTDGSIKIASEYAAKDKRIKVVHHDENRGTFHARSIGAFKASGQFILYLDPDDELSEGALDLINNQIDMNPNLDILLFDTKYQPELKFWNARYTPIIGVFKKTEKNTILKHNKLPYGTLGKLYSKKAAIQGYNLLSIPLTERLVYGEDILIFASVLLYCNLAVGINDKLYIYHRNSMSITEKRDKISTIKNIEQLELVIHYLSRLKHHKNYTKYFDNFERRIYIYKLSLQKLIADSDTEYLTLMTKLLIKTRSLRIAANLTIYCLTLRKVKR